MTCSYLSNAHAKTAACLYDWMLAAGLSVEIDAVGNVVGRWRSASVGAKTLMTGSHYDTVIDAGATMGDWVSYCRSSSRSHLRQRGRELPFDLEIVGFADEEGVRFKSTFLGSSAVAGTSSCSAAGSNGCERRDVARGHRNRRPRLIARHPPGPRSVPTDSDSSKYTSSRGRCCSMRIARSVS